MDWIKVDDMIEEGIHCEMLCMDDEHPVYGSQLWVTEKGKRAYDIEYLRNHDSFCQYETICTKETLEEAKTWAEGFACGILAEVA